MIEAGEITEFRHIFDVVPKTIVRGDIGVSHERMDKLIASPEFLDINHVYIISELSDVNFRKIIEIIYNQCRKNGTVREWPPNT